MKKLKKMERENYLLFLNNIFKIEVSNQKFFISISEKQEDSERI